MNNIETLIKDILIDYNFIGNSYDKKGNFTGHHYLYSKTIQLLPTQINIIKNKLPNFTLSHLYGTWYIVGFNKTK